jgi:hypothetical protein
MACLFIETFPIHHVLVAFSVYFIMSFYLYLGGLRWKYAPCMLKKMLNKGVPE